MQSEVNALLLRVTLGNPAEVNAALDRMTRDARWRRLQPLDRPYGPFVTTLALAGRTGEARRVLAEWAASVPDDLRRTQGWKMATARGEILLAERDGAAALAPSGPGTQWIARRAPGHCTRGRTISSGSATRPSCGMRSMSRQAR